MNWINFLLQGATDPELVALAQEAYAIDANGDGAGGPPDVENIKSALRLYIWVRRYPWALLGVPIGSFALGWMARGKR